MIIRHMQGTFGTLDGEQLRLDTGLNIIYAPNESGKSTWCAFLRAMLYGIDTSQRARAGFVPDKQKYAPWSGKPMAGELELEQGGKCITIRRWTETPGAPLRGFSAVYTGTDIPVPGLTATDAGEQLTGVSAEVFARSAFIGQGGLVVTGTPELEKRISAIVTSGEEASSYTEADAQLRAWLRRRRSGRHGALPELEGRITEVEEQLHRLERNAQEQAACAAELRQTDAELQTVTEQMNAARQRQRRPALRGLSRLWGGGVLLPPGQHPDGGGQLPPLRVPQQDREARHERRHRPHPLPGLPEPERRRHRGGDGDLPALPAALHGLRPHDPLPRLVSHHGFRPILPSRGHFCPGGHSFCLILKNSPCTGFPNPSRARPQLQTTMEQENKQIFDFDLKMIADFFRELDRQGPGGVEQTLRALEFVPDRPGMRIADIGCGTGGQTITIARIRDCTITAVDLLPELLEEFRTRIKKAGLENRVTAIQGSMDALPFSPGEFDVIWAEGSIYNIGFERGLREWRQYLKPGGIIAVTESSWLSGARLASKFISDYFPDIDSPSGKVRILEEAGYAPLAHFALPEHCWTEN